MKYYICSCILFSCIFAVTVFFNIGTHGLLFLDHLNNNNENVAEYEIVQHDNDNNCPHSGDTYHGDQDAVVDIRFPKARIERNDEYLCTAHPVPFGGNTSYIVGFTPQATMNVTHHIIVFACSNPFSEEPYWECGMERMCKGKRHFIYGWARNAPPVTLPTDIGFRVGKSSGIMYIVLQMHYVHRLPENSYDCSGLTVQMTTRPLTYTAGIFILDSKHIHIPPHSNVSVDVSCINNIPLPVHVFAFGTHTHGLGTGMSAYRVRNGDYRMIGKGNPRWPQGLYARVGGAIDLRNGDTLLGRCNYVNNGAVFVRSGLGNHDEMCSFYLMFYTENDEIHNRDLFCSGDHYPTLFPADANELAPFPGFAGQESLDAIESGEALRPAVPEFHNHNHHTK